MKLKIKKIITIVELLVLPFTTAVPFIPITVVAQNSGSYYAQPYPTVVHVMTHTSDPTVGYYQRSDYGQWGNLGTTKVVYHYVNTSTQNQAYNTLVDSISKNPGMTHITVWNGHGVTQGLGTDSALSKVDEARITTMAYEATGVEGGTVLDCCGSGTLLQYYGNNPEQLLKWGENNRYIITSSAANVVGLTPDLGGKVMSVVVNGKADANGDGVITVGELIKKMEAEKLTYNKAWKEMDPDTPMFAKDMEAMKKYFAHYKGFCGVVKPGEDEKYGNVYAEKKIFPANDDEEQYGKGSKAKKKDIEGNDKETKEESELNNKLRMEEMGHLKTFPENEEMSHKGQAKKDQDDGKRYTNYDGMEKDVMKDSKNTTKNITWVNPPDNPPSEDQAKESLSNKDTHAYTVPQDKKMQPGMYVKRTIAYDADKKPVSVGSDCVFREQKEIKSGEEQGNKGPGGGNNGGGGNQGSPGGGSPGGGSPGGGGSQPQGGQSQPNTQNQNYVPNQLPSSPSPKPEWTEICGNESENPVCAENYQTYPNRCIAERVEKLKVKHEGVCTEEELTRDKMLSDIVSLLQEAVRNGVPQSLLTNVINVISSMISDFFTKASGTKDTII